MRLHLFGIGARIYACHDALRVTVGGKLILLHVDEGIDAEGHDDSHNHPDNLLVVDAAADDTLVLDFTHNSLLCSAFRQAQRPSLLQVPEPVEGPSCINNSPSFLRLLFGNLPLLQCLQFPNLH